MRIKCKAFDVSISYVDGKTFMTCHSVADRLLGKGIIGEYEGYSVRSDSYPQISGPSTFLLGNDIYGANRGNSVVKHEPILAFEQRVKTLKHVAKQHGLLSSKSHFPKWW